MPLFIIGLVLCIALLVYVLVGFKTNEDNRSVRDRYPDIFRREENDINDPEDEGANSGDGKMLYFPTENIETEKHKRNIH